MAKYLDLDELLDNNQRIYVRNNALKAHLLLLIEVKDKNGRSRPLRVPPTDLPVDVSSQFPKELIRDCTELRHHLSKGTLILVDPNEAKKILSTREAQEELASVGLSVYADTAPANAVRDSMTKLKDSTNVVDSTEILNEPTMQDDAVQPRIAGLVASLQSKEKTSKEVLVQFKRLTKTLTPADLTYIINECGKETQIREFAEGALANLSKEQSV